MLGTKARSLVLLYSIQSLYVEYLDIKLPRQRCNTLNMLGYDIYLESP